MDKKRDYYGNLLDMLVIPIRKILYFSQEIGHPLVSYPMANIPMVLPLGLPMLWNSEIGHHMA